MNEQTPGFHEESTDSPINTGLHAAASPGWYGRVDDFSLDGAIGWLVDTRAPDRIQTLSATIGDVLVGRGTTGLERPDISAILKRPVLCGFRIEWDLEALESAVAEVSPNESLAITIRPEASRRALESTSPPLAADVRRWLGALGSLRDGSTEARTKRPVVVTPTEVETVLHAIPGQRVEPDARTGDVKLIAYYLPQFHPIPENDEWWGPGFTEWTNVAQGVRYFDDHYQPHVPGELGFYDLRLPEVREAQARLAREHGIYGFCYYYYWFAGRRLLERPLNEMFESGTPDFPFCICWANENWSRRWDGSEHEILVEQRHDQQTDEDFIRDVIPLMKDPRYIRVDGAPLLIVYRISLMPDPARTAETWRRTCAEEGIPKIHLCMSETFGLHDPLRYGFDASVQFPPHGVSAPAVNHTVEDVDPRYCGTMYDYMDVVRDQVGREAPPYRRYPGVMTSWDNTSRKKAAGNIFLRSSPSTYEVWLRGAIDQARMRLPVDQRFVFINAWNEWAEGAHLEPDRKHGRAYLEATRRALAGDSSWKVTLEAAETLSSLEGESKQRFVDEIRARFTIYDMVHARLDWLVGEFGIPRFWVRMRQGLPTWMEGLEQTEGGISNLDQLNQFMVPQQKRIGVDRHYKLSIRGWSIFPGAPLERDTPRYLILRSPTDANDQWTCLLPSTVERDDVAEAFSTISEEFSRHSGLSQLIDISAVTPGVYRIGVVSRRRGGVGVNWFGSEVEIA